MSSSPISHSSHSRASRKQEIPANLILNWQSSTLQGVKPLMRRPKTACERCRTAKVKCPGDGERDCARCTSRGLSCRYAQSAPLPSPAFSRPQSGADRTVQEDTQVDFRAADPMAFLGGANGISQQMLDSSADWSNMNDICPPESGLDQHMDWDAMDPSLDWSSGDRDLAGGLLNTSITPPSTLSNTTDHTPTSDEQQSLSRLGLYPFVTSTTATSELSQQNLFASQSCQCRSGFLVIIPNARAALQKRRLDVVCEVTGELVRKCQDIVDCRECDINCTDLICIMSIFQEADGCFDYIANTDIDGTITVSLGSYKTIVDEPDVKHWRRIAKGQDLLERLNPGCRLGKTNIDYLEAVIRNSKDNFHQIIKGFHEEARMAK
ncbi:putative Zn(2)-C6 fungal-type domain-containing protein [Seiridium cardinale]|uniref:Zn(2)-C6 fungal-type domain-containing protein n=1 Tax=Seiridium cardinale TaxID=138064 RepID=A0ABR2XGD2_9PEZI